MATVADKSGNSAVGVVPALQPPDVANTGWADYVDTEYTEGSPFQPSTSQWSSLPNNGEGGVKTQEPQGIDLYDAAEGKITGRNGDGLLITIEMTAKPTTASTTYLEVAIDIGGSVGRIYPRTITFPKGQNQERTFSFTVAGYTLDTWEANGGQVVVNPNAAIDLYNIRYVLTRTHKSTNL